jgi:hypothetical protein
MIFVLSLSFNLSSSIRFPFLCRNILIRTLSLPIRVRVHPFIQHPLRINHKQISLRNRKISQQIIIFQPKPSKEGIRK